MEQNKKTNEQLHEELEQALANLSEKLRNLINNGSYKLVNMSRDWTTQALSWATMEVGPHRIHLQASSPYGDNKGTEISLSLPDNPVTQEVMESWDRQTILHDIEYHQSNLEKLQARKKELGME